MLNKENIYFYNIILISSVGCTEKEKRSTVSDKLGEYFDSMVTNRNFNGAVLYKENGITILKKSYGFANYELKTPFKTSTQMEIASVSKQFTAMAILVLQKQGKIDLDSPANYYLNNPLPNDLITVRHLLTHTSGLPKYENFFHKNWDKERKCTNQDILEYYTSYKPELLFKPGTDFKYSNGGYITLAEIVKCVSGYPLDVFLEKIIFKPYGFEKTGFFDRQEIIWDSNFAPGYFYDSVKTRFVIPESIPGKEYYSYLSDRLGPGRLVSTVEELALWDSLLNENFLLSDSLYIEMFTPQVVLDVETNYALGWRVNTDPEYGWHIYHTGTWGGNKTK